MAVKGMSASDGPELAPFVGNKELQQAIADSEECDTLAQDS